MTRCNAWRGWVGVGWGWEGLAWLTPPTSRPQLLQKPKYSLVEKIKTIGSTYMVASGLHPGKEEVVQWYETERLLCCALPFMFIAVYLWWIGGLVNPPKYMPGNWPSLFYSLWVSHRCCFVASFWRTQSLALSFTRHETAPWTCMICLLYLLCLSRPIRACFLSHVYLWSWCLPYSYSLTWFHFLPIVLHAVEGSFVFVINLLNCKVMPCISL